MKKKTVRKRESDRKPTKQVEVKNKQKKTTDKNNLGNQSQNIGTTITQEVGTTKEKMTKWMLRTNQQTLASRSIILGIILIIFQLANLRTNRHHWKRKKQIQEQREPKQGGNRCNKVTKDGLRKQKLKDQNDQNKGGERGQGSQVDQATPN